MRTEVPYPHRVVSPIEPDMTEALCSCGAVFTETWEMVRHMTIEGGWLGEELT